MVATFLTVVCYWTTTCMIVEIETCYQGDNDVINPDAYIAGSEQTAFALLRVRLDDAARLGGGAAAAREGGGAIDDVIHLSGGGGGRDVAATPSQLELLACDACDA